MIGWRSQLRRIVFLLLVWGGFTGGVCSVLIETTSPNIDGRGISELAGTITLTVIGDDYWVASPQSPVYGRFHLHELVGLASSRVLPTPDIANHNPLYLAVMVEEDSDAVVVLPEDAVSIARWLDDENAFWLKFTRPTSEWITVNGQPQIPSAEYPVRIKIGISAQESLAEVQALFEAGKANRSSNSYVDGFPASTELFVDASQSILQVAPDPMCELTFCVMPFDGETVGVETFPDASSIMTGNHPGTAYEGDDVLAVAAYMVPTLDSAFLSALVVGLLGLGLVIRKRQGLLR